MGRRDISGCKCCDGDGAWSNNPTGINYHLTPDAGTKSDISINKFAMLFAAIDRATDLANYMSISAWPSSVHFLCHFRCFIFVQQQQKWEKQNWVSFIPLISIGELRKTATFFKQWSQTWEQTNGIFFSIVFAILFHSYSVERAKDSVDKAGYWIYFFFESQRTHIQMIRLR